MTRQIGRPNSGSNPSPHRKILPVVACRPTSKDLTYTMPQDVAEQDEAEEEGANDAETDGATSNNDAEMNETQPQEEGL